MAAYEVLLLNTAIPQIQAAQSGDTYVVPRDIAFSAALTLSAGTANGVPYLNGTQVVTTGSALTFDGTNFATTGSGTLKNLLLTGGTLPGAGTPSISLRSSDNVVYHQSGSANTIVLLDSSQNTMQSIGATAQVWNISNIEQMRLNSSGLEVKGNLVMSTSGKGIDFSANTHAAGMTSELLDWFEEGNWTPTDDSGAGLTLTVQSAKYVRIGRTVFVQAYVIYPSTASGADAKLAGLPFTVATNIYAPFSSTSGSGTAISVQANSATSKMTIVSPSNYNTAITNSTLSNTGIIFSGHYTV